MNDLIAPFCDWFGMRTGPQQPLKMVCIVTKVWETCSFALLPGGLVPYNNPH